MEKMAPVGISLNDIIFRVFYLSIDEREKEQKHSQILKNMLF